MTLATLRLHPDDDVIIALQDLAAGTACNEPEIVTLGAIQAGHKIASRALAAGETVRKYGQVIGIALHPIAPGEQVHSHNLGMTDPGHNMPERVELKPLPSYTQQTGFEGFLRPSGQFGTRNYLGIVTTVNCAGSVARFIAENFLRDGGLNRYPNIDGVVPLVHGTGCGMANQGESHDLLLRTLSGYAQHPNFAGVLVLSLGCEVMQASKLLELPELHAASHVRHLDIQQTGGTRPSVAEGLRLLHELAESAQACSRSTAPISALRLGMQCGGSDGYSGITANPALGVASDLLVQHGGTSILSETPEIYGAEHLLLQRCSNKQVRQTLLERLDWWQDYAKRNGAELDNNPSPGNKRGGLTTILEKSLGAVAKGGSAPLNGFYQYAEPIVEPGFVFMDSPGYDPCSVTGQIASGANLIAFTTGRGSVSGYMPVPGIKLATTQSLFERMGDDMDINCGDVLEGVPLADKGTEIFDYLLEVASGRKTKSETLGFGSVEFVPWQIGAVM